jgi:hypothetical protein
MQLAGSIPPVVLAGIRQASHRRQPPNPSYTIHGEYGDLANRQVRRPEECDDAQRQEARDEARWQVERAGHRAELDAEARCAHSMSAAMWPNEFFNIAEKTVAAEQSQPPTGDLPPLATMCSASLHACTMPGGQRHSRPSRAPNVRPAPRPGGRPSPHRAGPAPSPPPHVLRSFSPDT